MVQSLIKEFCPHFSKLYLFFYVLTFCLGPTHMYYTHDDIWRGVRWAAESVNANTGHSITCAF